MTTLRFSHPLMGDREMDSEDARIRRLRKRADAWGIAMLELVKTRPGVTFWAVMLTYRDQKEIRPGERQSPWSPNDMTEFQRKVTAYYGEHLLAYLWVAERHESGALHYHVCIALAPEAGRLLHADRNGWWRHGWSGTRQIERPSRRYLTKYLQKARDSAGQFHKGQRIFAAVIRCVVPVIARFWFKLSAAVGYVRRFVLHYSMLRAVVGDETFLAGWRWRPLEGGGWLVSCYNFVQVVESEWRLVGFDLSDEAQSSANRMVGGAYNYE